MEKSYNAVLIGASLASAEAARLLQRKPGDVEVAHLPYSNPGVKNPCNFVSKRFVDNYSRDISDRCFHSEVRKLAVSTPSDQVIIDASNSKESPLGYILNKDYLRYRNYMEDNHVQQYQLESFDDGNITASKSSTGETFDIDADYIGIDVGTDSEFFEGSQFDRQKLESPIKHTYVMLSNTVNDEEFINEYGSETVFVRFSPSEGLDSYIWCQPSSDGKVMWGAIVQEGKYDDPAKELKQYLGSNGKGDLIQDVGTTTYSLPSSAPLQNPINDNVCLLGDTARHTDPLHFADVMFNTKSAMAFSEMVSVDDITSYRQICNRLFMDDIQQRSFFRSMLYTMGDGEIEDLGSVISEHKFTSPDSSNEIPRLVWKVLNNNQDMLEAA